MIACAAGLDRSEMRHFETWSCFDCILAMVANTTEPARFPSNDESKRSCLFDASTFPDHRRNFPVKILMHRDAMPAISTLISHFTPVGAPATGTFPCKIPCKQGIDRRRLCTLGQALLMSGAQGNSRLGAPIAQATPVGHACSADL